MTKVIIDTPSGVYWDNEGKYQAQYDAAWKALIPASGEAEDGLPESLRAISRIGYDYYNTGFCNLWQHFEEYDGDEHYDDYVMDSDNEDLVDYLRGHIPSNLHQDLHWFLQDAQGYGNWSDQAGVLDRIIDYLMEQIIEEELIPQANA